MARGIKDKVAILGMGCSKFGERWDCGAEELMVEAYKECLADAGIEAMVAGASLAGFRAEAPADVSVVVRDADAQAAREALAAVRPEIVENDVGDDSPPDAPASRPRVIDLVFPAALVMGFLVTLATLGLWLSGLPSLQLSPLDFVFAFGGLLFLWLFWEKRRV